MVDQSGQRDQIDVSLAALAPRSRIDAALETASQLTQAAIRQRMQPPVAQAAERSEQSSQLEARIKELGERVRKLEAAAGSDSKSQGKNNSDR